MGRLAAMVHVLSPEGESTWFGPDDKDLPKWAKDAIVNPAAWAEEPERADDTEPAAPAAPPAADGAKPYPDGEPVEDWTGDQLKAYAKDHDVALGSATKKADIVAAIAAAKSA